MIKLFRVVEDFYGGKGVRENILCAYLLCNKSSDVLRHLLLCNKSSDVLRHLDREFGLVEFIENGYGETESDEVKNAILRATLRAMREQTTEPYQEYGGMETYYGLSIYRWEEIHNPTEDVILALDTLGLLVDITDKPRR
jgi:hypothetical protein